MLERKILILYGSQTGTAQDVSERIWREAKFFNFTGPVLPMDDYPVNQLIQESLVIFVVSTTGQGEEPDNMKLFWKFLLRRNLPTDSLRAVRYAAHCCLSVLGLGDSSYVKFNFVAKRLTRRLDALGGVRLVDTGYADDQHDLGADAVVDPWLSRLWAQIGNLFNFTAGPIQLKLEPRWRTKIVEKDPEINKVQEDAGLDKVQYSQRHPCVLRVQENLRTTADDHFQDVRLIKLKADGDLNYQPGDVLMIVPQNSDKNVSLLFELINNERNPEDRISSESIVQIQQKDTDLPVPEMLRKPIRLSECAKKYWDLNVVPRRHVFALLSEMATSDLEKEKLHELSEAAGQEDLYNYCNRPKRTILEVFADFPSAIKGISLDMLFDVLQPIKPRAFSIASSPKMHSNEIHVLLAVVQYKTKLMSPRQGLCSTYLASLPIGSTVLGWTRSGSFRFPEPPTPVIMVGPGTGVAPFRSYVQELAASNQASSNVLLFFGCRSKTADFHFSEEWSSLIDKGQINFVSAFSRDQPDKIYVQHRIEEHGKEVWDLLSRQAYVFIAGSSKNMPSSVRDAFKKIIQEHGGVTPEQAETFLLNMEKSGRYQTETWS